MTWRAAVQIGLVLGGTLLWFEPLVIWPLCAVTLLAARRVRDCYQTFDRVRVLIVDGRSRC
jgi:hypothetical protein